VCGLLPAGDLSVEHILTVWYVDGEAYEYHFRGRRQQDCFDIDDAVIRIYLRDAVVAYPLQIISTIEFTARAVPTDAPEVLEAERIIAAPSDADRNSLAD
jgi:hypothetical protein